MLILSLEMSQGGEQCQCYPVPCTPVQCPVPVQCPMILALVWANPWIFVVFLCFLHGWLPELTRKTCRTLYCLPDKAERTFKICFLNLISKFLVDKQNILVKTCFFIWTQCMPILASAVPVPPSAVPVPVQFLAKSGTVPYPAGPSIEPETHFIVGGTGQTWTFVASVKFN